MKKIFLLLSFIFFFFFSINASAMNFGLPKTYDGKRPYPGSSVHNLIVNNNGYYIGADTNTIYLSFDCGYENGYTEAMLDVLKEENVKGIFFITGHYLKSASNIVSKMVEDGHIIGNHGLNHLNYSKVSSSEMLHDINALNEAFEERFNTKMSKFVRPPEGAISETNAKVLADNGYISLYWSLAYVDWYKDKEYGNHYSYNNVIPRLHNGAIILMHTVGKDNMIDLKDIIITIREKGYSFGSVEELI